METFPRPLSTMFAPFPLNTTAMVSIGRWSVNDNEWLWTEVFRLTQNNQCVSQFGLSPQIQKRLLSLSFQMPGSLCLIHLPTWQSCVPWIKHLVFQHLKVKYILISPFQTYFFLDTAVTLRFHVKNAASVIDAEDVILFFWGGSAAKLSRQSAESCCGSLTPPIGAYSLSGGDPGG